MKHETSATGRPWWCIAIVTVVFLGGCAVTPRPADMGQLGDQGKKDRALLEQAQDPIQHPLRPDEAVARAILNNRERRVRAMQAALKNRQLTTANYGMLPSLTARAGYTERSDYEATASVPFDDGEPQSVGGDPSYSISREKQSTRYGVDFTWSILDFGLSYVRAEQKADQYLISQEQERKAILNLAQQTRAAYWKAVSAHHLLSKVQPLMKQVDSALDKSRQIGRRRLSDPMNALSYQRNLLDIKRSLGSLREQLIGARKRLARLMGMPPNARIPLPAFDNADLQAPKLPIHIPTMERTAFLLRPEILTSTYRERIARKEVRASFLKMFPDLTLSAGYQYDDNRYLRYNDWTSAGAQVSWDLLQIFQANAGRKAAKTGVEVAKERRLATSLAVLTQVHLAVLDFEQSRRKLKTSKNYLDVSRGIAGLVENQADSDSRGRLQVIKERLNALVAELRRDLAYAQVRSTFARVFKSMGLDPYPRQADSPAHLAAAIKTRRQAWSHGRIAVVVKPIADQQPVLTAANDRATPTFQFAPDTFSLAGDVAYRIQRPNGQALPDWLHFDSATRTFSGQPPADAESLTLQVRAENGHGVYAIDRFVLQPGETA